ncbi:Na/Pi cotransporter family protein [Nautilia lithotrophica]
MHQFLNFIGGLGLFLFALSLLESSIKNLGLKKLKDFVKKHTSSVYGGILVGFIVTAIIQSSSATTIIVLALVGAGIMPLKNSIGVILGANIGTTVTAWIVTILGFKVKIMLFANPLLAIGALGYLLIDNKKYRNIFLFFIAFALVFIGLEFMKESMKEIAHNINLADFRQYNFVFYLILGIIITAIIQSSSATTAIALTATASGIIDYKTALLIIIGANIGTTITAWLGSIGRDSNKKRVAFIHTIFNLTTGIIVLVILNPLSKFTLYLSKNDYLIAISLFHTIFNVLGVLIILPFVNILEKLSKKIIKDKPIIVTKYITNIDTSMPEIVNEALNKELKRFVKKSLKFYLHTFKISSKAFKDEKYLNLYIDYDTDEEYKYLKKLSSEIEKVALEVNNDEILKTLYNITISNKQIKDISHNIDEFLFDDNEYLKEYISELRNKLINFAKEFYEWYKNGGEKPTYKPITRDIALAIKNDKISPYISITLLNVNYYINRALENLINIPNHRNNI